MIKAPNPNRQLLHNHDNERIDEKKKHPTFDSNIHKLNANFLNLPINNNQISNRLKLIVKSKVMNQQFYVHICRKKDREEEKCVMVRQFLHDLISK